MVRPPRRPAIFDQIAQGTGFAVALMGLLVILGWMLRIELLKTGFPGLITMKVNTAICFVLAGLAVALTPVARDRRVGWFLSLGVLAITAATAFEYASGWNLGIDEGFATDRASLARHLPPGRMALASALALFCAGLSIGLVGFGRVVIAQLLTFTSMLIALFALVAYLFGERSLTMISPFTSLAVHTALGLFVLDLGILSQCVGGGPMAVYVADDPGGFALRRLLPIAITVTIGSGLFAALGVEFRLYSFAVALILMSVAASTVLAIAIWSNSRSLSQSDIHRRRELERFRLTLTSIGDAVIATDGRGRVTFINPVAESLIGWSATEAVDRPLDQVLRIINEATRQPVDNPVARVLATGEIIGMANRTVLIARDGTERPIEDSAAPIQDVDGSIAGVVLVFRDCTEQQRSSRLLNEQKQILERIARGGELPGVLDAICLLIEGQTSDPVFASVLLVSDDGTRWTLGAGPSLPPEYARVAEGIAIAHGIAAALPTAKQGDPVYVADITADPLWDDFVELARTSDLRDCWSCPIVSSTNEVLGVFALHRREPRPPSLADIKIVDIAVRTAAIAIERDRNRSELLDTQIRLESALSAGSIATWVWDLQRDWLVPDASLVRLFSIPPEDAAGGQPTQYFRGIHPDDRFAVEEALGESIATGKLYHTEYRVVQPDGSARAVEARGMVQYDSVGRPHRFNGVVLDITDRRQIEEEKDRLASLVEKSGEGIAIVSLDYMLLYANATLRRMRGLEGWDASRPISIRKTFYLEDHPFIFGEVYPRVLREGYARAEIRLRHITTDEGIWVDYGVTLLRSKSGEPLAFATISRDLTAQHQADRERRELAAHAESQARLFDSTLSNSPDIIYTFDLQGRFTYANKALLSLWQKSLPAAIGKTFFELDYPAEMASQLHEQVQTVIATKQPITDELLYTSPTSVRNYEHIFAPVLAPDGTVEAVVGSSRDITDRKLAEEANRLRANQMQKLAEISTRINAAHDVNSVVGVVAREALDLFGAGRSALSMILNPDFPQSVNVVANWGSDPEPYEPPDLDATMMADLLANACDPIRLTTAEVEADSRWRAFRRLGGDAALGNGWLAVPLVARDGKSMGLIQIADKREGNFTIEDEAVALQLSHLAAIAIENARLYDELRGNDRRKDEFLAMLAHELRNPLAAISNAVQILTRGGFEDHGARSVEIITRQIRHLVRLIEDLLDVSRISRGKIELRSTVLDVTPILDSAATTVRPLVDERKHTLTTRIDRGNLWVHADPTRLEQVVVNLLNNAAKYSENGGQIELRAWTEAEQVVIQVTDQGVGIAPEKLPQMFELFAQGDRSLARSEGGLGIGLTLVKKLVEMHGGTITARSDGPGHGSEFTVRLPSAPRPSPSSTTTPGADLRSTPVAAPDRLARILVVDDNIDTARGMARLLKLIGHTVATAHSGPEAIEAARQHHPEVVLLDIGLPGMSGYEVATQLRREPSCQGTIIIAVSGYGQEDDRRRSREAGFDHHLIKPLDHDALLALLAGSN